MNNSFARLIDGMCATLRAEVLTRLDDDFARGQVFGVINLLNTLKARADWSADLLLQQIAAQREAFCGVSARLHGQPLASSLPALPGEAVPPIPRAADLLQLRDEGNRSLGLLLQWLHRHGSELAPSDAAAVESLLQTAMRAEIDIELQHSPRPLFSEMSSGRESA